MSCLTGTLGPGAISGAVAPCDWALTTIWPRLTNLHTFHILQTVSNNTIGLDVGVPARGLHGEAYRGHVFWDELFIFPFLIVRFPELARSLLLYSYRRLDEARRTAAAAGFSGAMFPWQSGSNGREETQTMHLNPVRALAARRLPLQHHINAAIVPATSGSTTRPPATSSSCASTAPR